MKKLQMFEICVYQGNIRGFAKVCIIWPEKLGKGMCEFWSTPWKLNTLMKTRYLNFLFNKIFICISF
jgi:hypothetical protein